MRSVKTILTTITLAIGISTGGTTFAADDETAVLSEATFKGLALRNIGPAVRSGRIADLAIHPENENTWYVAVGSGGVWKTVNAGTTFEPIFDNEGSYSIGALALDPKDNNTVWVGTGEHGGGRHFGFGDGVYKSSNGGKTWTNMGLKDSQHIGKIIIHPNNPNTVYVAAQGPLWSPGGERGFYKSTDGGLTWSKTLGDEEFTGVTDIAIDPRNPERVYAATWQHQRSVASLMDGGAKSAIYRSEDGGDTWTQLAEGLPEGKMGKIGLAISPQQPDIVYAAIELNRRKGGIWKSLDRGESWTQQSDVISGGTGAHYYVELYASPHRFDHLYLMDAQLKQSTDGGMTWGPVNREHRHGDNHALAFKLSDPDYLLLGTDGGVYESFDQAANWRYMPNLPITQFYKLAVDDAAPFYNIYSGTQDNGTQGGPSRTDSVNGIRNADWRLVLDWDGHAPATEPGNPDIVYAERQEGALSRIDMTTGEVIDIQPQPREGEDYERFNWDAPIHVSPHDPARIYFASQRVWRSDNRGDSWQPISGDLTRNEERFELPIMGRQQSWDSSWDVLAMSNYNSITSLSESPLVDGLIYAGTDDGLLQITDDGGKSWRRIEVSRMGVPDRAFINDIKADLHDPDTVYVSLDNHKYGDYSPYLVRSTNRGRSWESIGDDLPDRHLVWRMVQDHEKPELLFTATEFGVFFSIDAGDSWIELEGGVPTIAFRDLAIQRRENDLVGASFGRGFFVLDDYSVLREVSEASLKQEGSLYSTRKAWLYIPRSDLDFDDFKGSQGASHYVAPNPSFGAVFTYHLSDGLQTLAEARQKAEEPLEAAGKDIKFPGWDAVGKEATQAAPAVLVVVRDAQGNVVRRVEGPADKGFHRIAWDLRYPAPNVIALNQGDDDHQPPQGLMAAPGKYTATLYKRVDGQVSQLDEPIGFEVERLYQGTLPGASDADVATFWRAWENSIREASQLALQLKRAVASSDAMDKALTRSRADTGQLDAKLHELRETLHALNAELNGNPAKVEVGEKTKPTVSQRLSAVERTIYRSLYGPTQTSREGLALANKAMESIGGRLDRAESSMRDLAKALVAAGAPYVEGVTLD
ncbi:glycosyl hydrolase [Congregibacter variabilis]|uniref:Glycosyl hydrolase n=1 Tax=Congregibacter variabilis TaxID=3081200 RepID=A0ABZ0I0Y4_9GAMM|nr:glycosyl hydrolase [Congregibacter sp. IMCC43200]